MPSALFQQIRDATPRQRQDPQDPDVQHWLARHKRVRFHFTPTSASWMNEIETWFGILGRQAIRRGTFDSVKALVAMIERFTRQWNDGASPFTLVSPDPPNISA